MDRSYRVYNLDADGRIGGAQNREFQNDREALDFAQGLLDTYPGLEVWQTDRLVGCVHR